MGILKWVARKGAVGGTARWAASLYTGLRARHPETDEWPDFKIFQLMVALRYPADHEVEVKHLLWGLAENMKGLRALVAIILDQEAGFTDNTHDNQIMFLEIIDEELGKQGLSRQAIYGASSD